MKRGICISPKYGLRMKTYSVFSGSGKVLNIASKCSSDVLPATLISGLGLLHVCGRIRVPQPAMGITTLRVSVNAELQKKLFTHANTIFLNDPKLFIHRFF